MKASVVIPAFNAEKTIAKCLESIEGQSFRDFEVIVVDDGSKDRTAEIVRGFSKARLLRQKNAGPAVARNNGAKKALGGIIVFTDSDCVADKDWLKEMLEPFQDAKVAGVQGRYKSRQKELVARLIQLEIEQRYAKMLRRDSIDFIGTYSAAYRKSVFAEMRGFDTSFPIASGEDTDLSFRVSGAGYRMAFNQRAIIFHTHPTSLWKYLKVKYYRAFWRTKVYKRHRGKMVKDSYTSQVVKAQTVFFLFGLFLLALSPVFPVYLPVTGVVFVGLFLSTLRFAWWAFPKDHMVGLVSPFTGMMASGAFGLGFLMGVLREAIGR